MKFYSIGKTAELLGVCRQTLLNYEHEGTFIADSRTKSDGRGHRRYSQEQIDRYISDNKYVSRKSEA